MGAVLLKRAGLSRRVQERVVSPYTLLRKDSALLPYSSNLEKGTASLLCNLRISTYTHTHTIAFIQKGKILQPWGSNLPDGRAELANRAEFDRHVV